MSIMKKIITKPNAHYIKPKQNNLAYTSFENIWDLSSKRLVNRMTKKSKKVRGSKIRFFFKQIISQLLMSLDITEVIIFL